MKGIKNLGSNCYLNCILQTLFLIEELNKELKKSKAQKSEFAYQYLELYQIWNHSQTQIVDPSKLMKSFQDSEKDFDLYKQQDAQECLLKILEHLHNSFIHQVSLSGQEEGNLISQKSFEAWKDYISFDGYSPIKNYFTGQKIKNICCSVCQNVFYDFEFFMGITLSISEEPENSLDKLLLNYFQTEQLSRECSQCKKIQNCVIQTNIYHPPKVLFFCLKRFDYHNRKIKKSVLVPETLTINTNKYSLFSVVNHIGTHNSGHYHCLVPIKDQNENKLWVKCDDETLSLIKKGFQDLDTCNNYIIFYIKQ